MNALAELIQGTDEWRLARCGRATSSCFADILAKGERKMRDKYLRRIVAERLTGKPIDGYRNAHMDRGNEQEGDAREAYEIATGNLIETVGFIPHEKLMAGCSPDGLIGTEGGGEFKCVIPTVQMETVLKGGFPTEHRAQIQGCLWITGRAWWDFCSYSPDLPERLSTYIFRVERDDRYIATLAVEVEAFLKEADALYNQLIQKAA